MAAPIDLKNCTINICDGRLSTLTIGAGNAGILFTSASRHLGSRSQPRVVFVVSGNNTPLSVSVGGTPARDITVNVATDGGGLPTSTAAQVRTALLASAPATALVTPTLVGDGTGTVAAAAIASLATGARLLEMKIGQGTLRFSEKKAREYIDDKGNLDEVRNADEEPVDLSFDFKLDYVSAVGASGTPTPEEAMSQEGEASTWVSTGASCEPFCIDIELEHDPTCAGVTSEYLMFEMFRWESLDFDPKAGRVSASGKCNVTTVKAYRE
jgi:hypothetical protein